MATANQSPIFTLAPVIAQVVVSAANTNRTATGTRPTLLTGAAFGTLIDRIRVKAQATTTAGMLRFWISDGVTDLLFHEEPVAAVTPSGTVPAFSVIIANADGSPFLDVPSAAVVRVSTQNGEAFNVFALAGTY